MRPDSLDRGWERGFELAGRPIVDDGDAVESQMWLRLRELAAIHTLVDQK